MQRYDLTDAPALVEATVNRLMWDLSTRMDRIILEGSEAHGMTGLRNTSGTLVQHMVSDRLITIRHAISALEAQAIAPSAVVLSVNAWREIETSRTADGEFVFASGPVDRAEKRIWGVPVVVTTQVPQDEAYVLDANSAAVHMVSGEPIFVETSDAHGDDFAHNRTRIRMEARYGGLCDPPVGCGAGGLRHPRRLTAVTRPGPRHPRRVAGVRHTQGMEMKPQMFTCGWCQTRATGVPVLDPEPPPPGIWDVADSLTRYAVFQCEECRGRVIARWESPGSDWEPEGNPEWFPKAPSMNEYPGVPESIADTARESWGCFESDHYRSAVTTARTVIEQVCKSHGYRKGGFDAKIISMVHNNVLPKRIKDAVTALKDAGNTMVHGDLGASFTAVETETLLTVMDQMLEEVYVAPKRIHDLTQAVLGPGGMPATDADEDAQIQPAWEFCDL